MLQPIEKIEGFIYRSIPKSQEEVASHLAFGKVLAISKSAIQWVIKSFLDGKHKHLLNLVAPFTLEWTSASLDRDSRLRQIQLARIWQGLRASIPQILIGDTGAEYVSAGLGMGSDISFPIKQQGKQVDLIPLLMNIDITIQLATLDEGMFDQLFTAITLILGPLLKRGPGHIVTPRSIETGQAEAGYEIGNWEVRLPLDSFAITGKSGRPRGDDPKDKIYIGSFNFPVAFEDHIGLAWDKTTMLPGGSSVGTRDTYLLEAKSEDVWKLQWDHCMRERPDRRIPDRVHLRTKTIPIQIPLPMGAYCYSDNARVALVRETSPGGSLIIVPKTMGKFNFIIARKNQPIIPSDPGSNIIFSKEVIVGM